ncbi:MAG TPA: hypothetical protein VFQ70_03850 [Candidatus Saccharimonadaceae bacterium]|nr:hypothetical protein [Candidatus Saccharimonadaceae bacterium]
MTAQQNPIKSKRLVLITTVAIAIIVVSIGITLVRHSTSHASTGTRDQIATPRTDFFFTKTPGWWQGATNATSLAAFSNDHTCFASMEYKTGTIDVATTLRKDQVELAGNGYTVTPTATQELSLKDNGDRVHYTLYQYSVTGAGNAGQLKGGQEFGYAQLPSGYVNVQAYCDTPAQLPSTIPALQAYSFTKK